MSAFRNQRDGMGSKAVRFDLYEEESFCQKALKPVVRA